MSYLPNLISFLRLLCVPAVIWAILDDRLVLAFWLFLAAGISDAIDGFLARAFDAHSLLGTYLDPLADKALLIGMFATLGVIGLVPSWLVLVVISRDVMIVGGAVLLHTLGRKAFIGPLFISKINTVFQIGLVAFVLATAAFTLPLPDLGPVLVLLTAATTVASGFAYLLRWSRTEVAASADADAGPGTA